MNFIAILAAAITLQLSPGLSEPVGGDGARLQLTGSEVTVFLK